MCIQLLVLSIWPYKSVYKSFGSVCLKTSGIPFFSAGLYGLLLCQGCSRQLARYSDNQKNKLMWLKIIFLMAFFFTCLNGMICCLDSIEFFSL